jgi:hypothetical protein
MHAPIRLLVSLVFLSGGLGGVAVVRPGWIRGLGLQWEDAHHTEVQCLRQAEQESVVRCTRWRAKVRTIDQLFAGNLTLFEAAEWFGAINATPADFPDLTWQTMPGQSDDEKLCRQVIFWCRSRLDHTLLSSPVHVRVKELEEDLEGSLAPNRLDAAGILRQGQSHMARQGTVAP